MFHFKKRIWVIAFFVSLMLIWINYAAIIEFMSHRSYTTFSEEELTTIFLTAEFVAGEEIQLEKELPILTENISILAHGDVHRAELSDGRKVLAISKCNMGYFEINKPLRGRFVMLSDEVSYLAKEYDVEPYVFYCFEKYLSEKRTFLVMYFVGIAAAFLCICGLLSKLFPELFPALFKREEQNGVGIRDSNFELLRIICMVMIIMHHLGIWGEFDIAEEITLNTMILQWIVSGGKIGVNCFMMITGYYCVFSTFKPSKITKLVAQVWFYTWTIAICLFSTGVGIRSIENVQKSVFPICSGTFWFITVYLIVYVLSPYINQAIRDIEQKKYKILLVFLFVIWSVIPSIVKPGWEFSNTGWMVYMYLIGAYFRRFPAVWDNSKVKLALCFVGTYIILMCSIFVWNKRVGVIVYNQTLAQKHTIPIVICSVALFVFFKNINIGQRRIVNKIAASTFSVYLIHENPVLNDLLWTEWFKVNTYFRNEYFGWYALGAVLTVYVICTMIDIFLCKLLIICNYMKCLLVRLWN